MIEYAELPHQDYVVHLGTGAVDHNLPLGGYFLLYDLVGRCRGHYLPVGEAVVVGNCVVGRGQLLLAPVVAIGDEPIVSLLVGIGPGYFRHGRLYYFLSWFLSEHLEEVGPANSLLLAVGEGPLEELDAFGEEVAPFEDV